MIRYIRNIILTALFIGLIITNILILLYQPFTTTLSAILTTAFGITTVSSILETTLDAKDMELSRQKETFD